MARNRRLEAFETLGLSVDADRITASKAYKRLALTVITEMPQPLCAFNRFCLSHNVNPADRRCAEYLPTTFRQSGMESVFRGFNSCHHFNADHDIPLDEELLHEFYMWVDMRTPHVQINYF